jgi:hypothetical protein
MGGGARARQAGPTLAAAAAAHAPPDHYTLISTHLYRPLLQDGSTPLHRAAYIGSLEVVVQLLAGGAAVDATNVVRATNCAGPTWETSNGFRQLLYLRVEGSK